MYKKEESNSDLKKSKKMAMKDYIIFLLGRREYSTKEIETKLKNREHTKEEIEEGIKWAIESGFQSNSRYAISQSKARSIKKGNRGIAYEMKTKGINDDEIESAINNLEPEIERILLILQKYKNEDLDNIKIKEKAFRSLASKGFAFNNIKKAWEQFIE